MRIVFLFLLPLISIHWIACPKPTPTALSVSEVERARSLFTRHLQAIGATTEGIPHTALKMTGSMEYVGESGRNSFTIEQQIPNLYYIRISLAGTGVFERGFDGQRFWERTPRESRFLKEEEIATLQATIDFQRWAHHMQWYPEIHALETVEFAGESCDALTTTTQQGTQERLMFSQSTGLLMGIEQLGEANSITRFGQYLVHDNIKIPTYWEDKREGIHRVWKVEQFEWDRNDVDFRPPPNLLEER